MRSRQSLSERFRAKYLTAADAWKWARDLVSTAHVALVSLSLFLLLLYLFPSSTANMLVCPPSMTHTQTHTHRGQVCSLIVPIIAVDCANSYVNSKSVRENERSRALFFFVCLI